MKSLDSQNHYEVLEVPPSARGEDIESAYRMANATWADGSLALYSVFDDADAATVRARIRTAYQVLSDQETRLAYDEQMGIPRREGAREAASAGRERDDFNDFNDFNDFDDFDEMEVALAVDEEKGNEFDGTRLRRARMRRGIELDQIGDITKISRTYLQFIEDEDYDKLPAPVYVRGFVAAYARAIGLDANKVARGYMEQLEEARGGRSRAGLLSRK